MRYYWYIIHVLLLLLVHKNIATTDTDNNKIMIIITIVIHAVVTLYMVLLLLNPKNWAVTDGPRIWLSPTDLVRRYNKKAGRHKTIIYNNPEVGSISISN